MGIGKTTTPKTASAGQAPVAALSQLRNWETTKPHGADMPDRIIKKFRKVSLFVWNGQPEGILLPDETRDRVLMKANWHS